MKNLDLKPQASLASSAQNRLEAALIKLYFDIRIDRMKQKGNKVKRRGLSDDPKDFFEPALAVEYW
jgi:hypothetical protein